ncbi:MAG: cupin domain-containing protein [Candidatus Aminicenantes bacterium]|nr:cupin domain-containing protein [Candidatus Aminicenantes bacterium]
MKIASLDSIPKTKVEMAGAENAFRQTAVSKNDGAPHFSFRVFTLEPGGHTPYHRHPFEHVNYCIDGEGAVVDEQGREHSFRKGDFALILPDEKHQYRNRSKDQPLKFICAVPKEYE